MRLSKRDPRDQQLPQFPFATPTILGPSGFTGFIPSPTELWAQCISAAIWLAKNNPEA